MTKGKMTKRIFVFECLHSPVFSFKIQGVSTEVFSFRSPNLKIVSVAVLPPHAASPKCSLAFPPNPC